MLIFDTQDELDQAAGTKKTAPAAPGPLPAPPAPMPNAQDLQLTAMQEAMTHMAEQMARLPAALEAITPPAPVKSMTAIPFRNRKDQIERIEITINR